MHGSWNWLRLLKPLSLCIFISGLYIRTYVHVQYPVNVYDWLLFSAPIVLCLQAVEVNALLKVYRAIDKRVKVLGVAFRYWAKVREWCVHAYVRTYMRRQGVHSLLYCMLVGLPLQVCRLDDKESGLYPSIMFIAMVIYFLQQKAMPVLPVLHEVRVWGLWLL